MTQEENIDLCKTCEHYWQDFLMPDKVIISHCEILDNKYGMYKSGMDELIPYPCIKCPFDCYSKKK